jgi:hypothetical protein
MKHLFITSILVLAFSYSNCQTQYYNQYNDQDNHEILTAQQAGYALTGIGALTIIYTASDIYPVKNPTAWYVGGSSLIAAGVCFLIFGNKDPEPKYWRGMQGYMPDKGLKNDLLISILEPAAFSNLNLLNRNRENENKVDSLLTQ